MREPHTIAAQKAIRCVTSPFPAQSPCNSYSVCKTYFQDKIHKKETNIRQYYINTTWRNISETILSIWKKYLLDLAKKTFKGKWKTLTMIFWKIHPPSGFIPHNTNLRRLEIFFFHGKADKNY